MDYVWSRAAKKNKAISIYITGIRACQPHGIADNRFLQPGPELLFRAAIGRGRHPLPELAVTSPGQLVAHGDHADGAVGHAQLMRQGKGLGVVRLLGCRDRGKENGVGVMVSDVPSDLQGTEWSRWLASKHSSTLKTVQRQKTRNF
eukprot:scaffold65680_cov30-Prasinocladus_malaysianus.AAC.2